MRANRIILHTIPRYIHLYMKYLSLLLLWILHNILCGRNVQQRIWNILKLTCPTKIVLCGLRLWKSQWMLDDFPTRAVGIELMLCYSLYRKQWMYRGKMNFKIVYILKGTWLQNLRITRYTDSKSLPSSSKSWTLVRLELTWFLAVPATAIFTSLKLLCISIDLPFTTLLSIPDETQKWK